MGGGSKGASITAPLVTGERWEGMDEEGMSGPENCRESAHYGNYKVGRKRREDVTDVGIALVLAIEAC